MNYRIIKFSTLFYIVLLFLYCTPILYSQQYRWIKKVSGEALGSPLAVNPQNHNTIFGSTLLNGKGVISVSHNRGGSWEPWDTIIGGTNIKSIVVNPFDSMVILIAQEAQPKDRIMRTTDGGQTWIQKITGDLSYYGLSIEFNDHHPDTVFVMMGNVIYRSINFGDTWDTLSVQTQFDTWCDAAYHPDSSNLLFVGDNTHGIWKSTDGGITFRNVYFTTGEIPMLAIDPAHPSVMYATKWAGGGGLVKSTNFGESWIPIEQFDFLYTWGVATGIEDSSLVVMGSYTTFSSANGGIYISRDGGINWVRIVSGLISFFNYGLLPLDQENIFALMNDGIYRLETSNTIVTGTVYDSETSQPVNNGYVMVDGSTDRIDLSLTNGIFSAGLFNGVIPKIHIYSYPYYVDSASLNFQTDSTVLQDIYLQKLPEISVGGTVLDSLTGLPVHARITLVDTILNGIISYSMENDSSGKFRFDSLYIKHPPVVQSYQITLEPELPYAENPVEIISEDSSDYTGTYLMGQADVFVVGEDSADYFSYYKNALSYLGYNASYWNILTKGIAPFNRGTEFSQKIIIYFGGTRKTIFDSTELTGFQQFLDAGGRLFMTGQDIAEINDTARLFKDYLGVGFGANTIQIYCKGLTEWDLFAGSGFFTYGSGANNQISRDTLRITGSHTYPILGYGTFGNLGLSGVRVDSIGDNNGKAVFFSFGWEAIDQSTMRRIVMLKVLRWLKGETVLATHDIHPWMPVAFQLLQNYPNPFNPSTVIHYELPAKSHVFLKIYDMLGREVASLVDGIQDAGYQTKLWDASGFSSGIYIARLQTQDGAIQKKIVLMR